MNLANLSRIEREVTQLPQEEQLWLMERLAHHLRQPAADPSQDEALAAMAADPEIARELATIAEEFEGTEMDGLGDL